MHTMASGPLLQTSACASGRACASTHECSAKMPAHQAVDMQALDQALTRSTTTARSRSEPPQRAGIIIFGTPIWISSATVSGGSLPRRSVSAALATKRSAAAASMRAAYRMAGAAPAGELGGGSSRITGHGQRRRNQEQAGDLRAYPKH